MHVLGVTKTPNVADTQLIVQMNIKELIYLYAATRFSSLMKDRENVEKAGFPELAEQMFDELVFMKVFNNIEEALIEIGILDEYGEPKPGLNL